MSPVPRFLSALAALAIAAALPGCAGTSRTPATAGAAAKPHAASHFESVTPVADSITIALWHFDENGGTRAADAGPFRLDAEAGLDTRTNFGRFRAARTFQRSADSFVHVPYNPEMEPARGLTIEAWIYVNTVSDYELQVIAARWSPLANQQSWVFGVTGYGLTAPRVSLDSPGWFRPVTGIAPAMRLVFGYQPAAATGSRGYFSTQDIPLQRWVHVAASVDGDAVRLVIDGRTDSEVVSPGVVRASQAPLFAGNCFDPRFLTHYSGDLRVDPSASVFAPYAFDGMIDELRLSAGVRTRFESAPTQ